MYHGNMLKLQKIIQELFYYLETKRILTIPVEKQIKSCCVQSAIETKRVIALVLSKYGFNSDTICWLRAMINARNLFLDSLSLVKNKRKYLAYLKK